MTLLKTLVVCAAILLLFAFVLFKCHQNEESYTAPDKKVDQVKAAPVTHYTDAVGTDHAQKPVAVADLATLKKSYQATIDSLSKLLKIKPKVIKEIVQVGVVNEGDIKPTIDTLQQDGQASIEVSYHDKWLSIRGVVNEDSTWHYSVRDSLSFVTYKKKTGFLKRELFLDAFSHNPRSTVYGLTGIKVEAKPKKWGIGLFGGCAFNGRQWGAVGGFGITRTFIRF